MRRPPHIEAACTIAVASHHRALELAGRSLETRRPDAPPRFTSHRRAPASTQPSALRQAPAPLHSTIKSTPSRRLTLPSPPSSPNPRPSTPPSSAARAPDSSLPLKNRHSLSTAPPFHLLREHRKPAASAKIAST